MLRIEIIAAGKLKTGPLLSQWDEYCKRLQWKLTLHEIEGKSQAEEQSKIAEKINPQAYLVVLDERGKNIGSRDFAVKLDQQMSGGVADVQFLIGGADGHSKEVRERADLLLSFGSLTWPHMLARVMLIEQIYRAQQILLGHPYHRD